MLKLHDRLITIKVNFWSLLRRIFQTKIGSNFFLWILFLFYFHMWVFRLVLILMDFIFKARPQIYLDVYWYNFCLFVRDIFSSFLYTNLGDFVEKIMVYYYTPTAARSAIAKPYRTLVHYERMWYWQGNPAMFLPDKMWNDLVEIFDRKFGYKYKKIKKQAVIEFDNFINKPYTTIWRGLSFSIRWVISKRKLFRGFDIRGKFSRFFSDWYQRLKMITSLRAMYIYHGFDKKAILRGDIPALKASPYTYDFKLNNVIYKDNEHHVKVDNAEEKEINETFNEILSSKSIPHHFQPAISDFMPEHTIHNRVIRNLVKNKKSHIKFFKKKK